MLLVCYSHVNSHLSEHYLRKVLRKEWEIKQNVYTLKAQAL
jgi:hypothetical protein